METIRGKASREMGVAELKQRIAGYQQVLLDLGAGDGRYVSTVAQQQPSTFVIGVDACRDNLHEFSRLDRANMLFVIAQAEHLPRELSGLAAHITINFPWGSLLEGLLHRERNLLTTLQVVAAPRASLDILLNAGALAEACSDLAAGSDRIRSNLIQCGWLAGAPHLVDQTSLRTWPSTWARRLAHGRDPRVVGIGARLTR